MFVHNKGRKAPRDRAILIHSYNAMCREFHVPRKARLSPEAIARLSNEMLYKASADLYSQATVRQATRLAVKLHLEEHPASVMAHALWRPVSVIRDFLKRITLFDAHPELDESHSATREAARG